MVITGNVKRDPSSPADAGFRLRSAAPGQEKEMGEAESRKQKVTVNQLLSTISMTCGQLKGRIALPLSLVRFAKIIR
jgi:hypothetical protein